MNFRIFEARILRFLFIFAFFRIIYINLSVCVFLYVILCNNKANCSINCLFILIFNFLIFDYEYLFTHYILLIPSMNFRIFEARNLKFLLIFTFFRIIHIHLRGYVFLYIILCNNKANCSINCFFISILSFLNFSLRIPLHTLYSPNSEYEFQYFRWSNFEVFLIFAFFRIIHKNLRGYVFLYVKLSNNKANCSINCFFIYIFFFFNFWVRIPLHTLYSPNTEYEFQYFRWSNFEVFLIFAFFRIIHKNLRGYVFLYVKLCNNKANWGINCFFISILCFLIFGPRIPLHTLYSPNTEYEFQYFRGQNFHVFFYF